MKLISVRLENFKKFRDKTIEFDEGIIEIMGHNDAGKSTILDSIGWAIYGKDAIKIEKKMIKRTGASPDEECKVILKFELGESIYEVCREMIGKSLKPSAYVKIDDKLVVSSGANSDRDATQFLEKRILKMDRESFFACLIAKQGEISALPERAGDRKEFILGMLGVDAINKTIKRIREDKRDKISYIDGIKNGLKDPKELKSSLEENEGKKEHLKDDEKKLEDQLVDLEREADESREKIKREEEKSKKDSEKDGEIKRLKGILEGKMDSDPVLSPSLVGRTSENQPC